MKLVSKLFDRVFRNRERSQSEGSKMEENYIGIITGGETVYVPEKYELYVKEFLGYGAYGTVIRVKSLEHHEDMAVKMVHLTCKNKSDERNQLHARRAYREIWMLKELQHPNLVKLKALYCHEKNFVTYNTIHIVMEYAGKSLKSILFHNVKRRFSPIESGILLRHILQGLAYLHSRQVLHRDLKPENIAIMHDCNGGIASATILDIGMARVEEQDQEMSIEVVTFPYRSPEAFFHKGKYDTAIDMWAIGCIVYDLMSDDHYRLFQVGTHSSPAVEIFKLCGPPNAEFLSKSGKNERADAKRMSKGTINTMSTRFAGFSKDSRDFLGRTLELDTPRRITAVDALNHCFICCGESSSDLPAMEVTTEPLVKRPETMMSIGQLKRAIWEEIHQKIEKDRSISTPMESVEDDEDASASESGVHDLSRDEGRIEATGFIQASAVFTRNVVARRSSRPISLVTDQLDSGFQTDA